MTTNEESGDSGNEDRRVTSVLQLFVDVYPNAARLRSVLERTLPKAMAADLVGPPASLADLACSAAQVMARRCEYPAALFQKTINHAPWQYTRIHDVAASCGVHHLRPGLVPDVDEWAAQARRWALLAGALLLPVLFAGLGLFERLEASLNSRILYAVQHAHRAKHTVLVSTPEVEDLQSLRARTPPGGGMSHPLAIEQLVSAGVDGIVFDLTFTPRTPHDGELASAIRRAEAQDTPVVVAFRTDKMRRFAITTEPPALVGAGGRGHVIAPSLREGGRLVGARVQIDAPPPYHSVFHIGALGAARNSGLTAAPYRRGNMLRIPPGTTVPLIDGRLYLMPTESPTSIAYNEIATRAGELRNKVAVIGQRHPSGPGGQDWHRLPNGRWVPGYQVVAQIIEQALDARSPRSRSPASSAFVVLLTTMGVLGALQIRRLRPLAPAIPLVVLTGWLWSYTRDQPIVSPLIAVLTCLVITLPIGIWLRRESPP